MITSSETGTEKGAISINVADEIIAANEKLDPTKGSLSQAQNLKNPNIQKSFRNFYFDKDREDELKNKIITVSTGINGSFKKGYI